MAVGFWNFKAPTTPAEEIAMRQAEEAAFAQAEAVERERQRLKEQVEREHEAWKRQLLRDRKYNMGGTE